MIKARTMFQMVEEIPSQGGGGAMRKLLFLSNSQAEYLSSSQTTLIKMLKCEEPPDAGELVLGESVRLVSIEQTREGLTDANSVFEEMTGGAAPRRAAAPCPGLFDE